MKKTIQNKKKLSLNKETIRTLSNDDLSQVQGGLSVRCVDTTGRACLSTNFSNTKGGNAC